MEFGTIKSIMKKPEQSVGADTPELDKELDFGADEFGTDDLGVDDLGDGDKMSELLQRLSAVRDEIDSIFADMGYGDFGDDEFDDEFGDDAGFDPSEFEDEPADDEFDFNFDNGEADDGVGGEGEFSFDDETPSDFRGEEETGDPDFQGNIRTVAGANLVYKRKGEDGNFEELWIYNIGEDMKKESKIRRAVLAGTDIVPNQRESEDGSQHEETWSVGNVQYLKLTGLPN